MNSSSLCIYIFAADLVLYMLDPKAVRCAIIGSSTFKIPSLRIGTYDTIYEKNAKNGPNDPVNITYYLYPIYVGR